MDAERWNRIERLFIAALQEPPERRAEFLARECGPDRGLRDEVESLLRNDDVEDAALTGAVHEAAERATTNLDSRHLDRRIGAYRVVRELGHGGMGVVFLAHRADEAYEKYVAIKLLRFGLERDDLVRRFRGERQILATLDHPNIARLLDGGTTPDDEPYVVMDYVEGQPIDEYCDAGELTTESRLELFLTVCFALHYAHERSVVHRDIKPGNILVTSEGTPMLLDFGIAKLLDPEALGAPVVETGTATRLMTPEYASPEQIRGEPVTPATDVYALGLLLYELLTGRHPHRDASTHAGELARRICDEDPQRPSTAVTLRSDTGGAAEGAARLATSRRTVISRLRRRLSGDLDTIVLTALRKEPARRYASAQALAEDIRRHLDGMPIRARPASWGYRAGKFVRRKPVHAILLAVLALGVPTVAVLGSRALSQQRIERRAQVEELVTEARWLEERERYREVLARVATILTLDPGHALALRYRAWARYRISTETGDPAQAAEMQRASLEDARAVVRAVPDASWSHGFLAMMLHRLGREAEAEAAKARASRLERRSDEDLDLAARLAKLDGDLERAVELYSELVLRHPDRAPAMISLAYAYEDVGDLDAAFREYRVASGIEPDQDLTYIDLGRVSIERGELDVAERYLARALELDPRNAIALENLGFLLLQRGLAEVERGNRERAREHFLRAESSLLDGLALDGDLLWAEINLGTTLIHRSGLAAKPDRALIGRALEHYDRALSGWNRPPDSGRQRHAYSVALASRCDALIQLARLDEALACCRQVTEEFPTDAIGFYNLAGVLAQLGSVDDALAALERDLELGDTDWRYLRDDAWFSGLRGDERFGELLERMQRAAGD